MSAASSFQTFQAGPHRLVYRRSGQGTPLVLLHGLSGSRRWWRSNLKALEAVRCVYVVELVGYGSARRQRSLGVRAAARLLADWLDSLDLKGVDVVGHSMGGQIALWLTVLRPQRIRRLVLACASGLLRKKWWQVALKLPGAMRRGDLRFVPTILADGVRAGLPNLLRSSRDLLREDISELLPQIHTPTLVIWGERDVLVPPALGRMLAQAIAGASFVSLPRAGHVVMVDAPAEFNREVLRFLQQPVDVL
ncbi:alpha/beta fold hydrolase [Deinococcus ruber]|uniref:Dihydrolipoamide acetyltransferase n=1 Tax=Deinococcus ruber TaxID=1848197 RepID=A0A918BW28_9DEIO|nr:alpha/beta fold hydrolase [Deinococcus ruber]GGQ93749.1 dihydrolipoamide acetyltransferase [Deinococcus ruber]